MAAQESVEWDVEAFGYLPRHGVVGLCGTFISSFLRVLHADFQSSCLRLQSHQQRMSGPFPPPPHQHLQAVVLVIFAILNALGSLFVVVPYKF